MNTKLTKISTGKGAKFPGFGKIDPVAAVGTAAELAKTVIELTKGKVYEETVIIYNLSDAHVKIKDYFTSKNDDDDPTIIVMEIPSFCLQGGSSEVLFTSGVEGDEQYIGFHFVLVDPNDKSKVSAFHVQLDYFNRSGGKNGWYWPNKGKHTPLNEDCSFTHKLNDKDYEISILGGLYMNTVINITIENK